MLDKYRPKLHFTPLKNWSNDPNGLVFYNGEYHLFYQYNPNGIKWGPMHWGHAISKDMICWEHLPIALYPDENGMCFSGCAVVDKENGSKLFNDDNGLIIFYTNASEIEQEGVFIQNQSMAYSCDFGKTWMKYKKNPIIEKENKINYRDPCVVRYEEKWIMLVAADKVIEFYESYNLIDWEKTSEFGKGKGVQLEAWECPEFIKFTIDSKDVWVLKVSIQEGGVSLGSGEHYFIGSFDGYFFKELEENKFKWIDYGKDFYASQLWSNVKNRKILIAWMSNFDYSLSIPTSKSWRGLMSIPRELKLIKEKKEYILTQLPIKEIENYRTNMLNIEKLLLKANKEKNINTFGGTQELLFTIKSSKVSIIKMNIRNDLEEKVEFVINRKLNTFKFLRNESGETHFGKNFAIEQTSKYSFEDKIDIRLLIDSCSIEIFIDDGKHVITNLVFPKKTYNTFSITSNSDIKIENYYNYLF